MSSTESVLYVEKNCYAQKINFEVSYEEKKNLKF